MNISSILKEGAALLFELDTVETITFRRDTSTFDEDTLLSVPSQTDIANVKVQATTPAFLELEDKVTLANNIVVEPEDLVFLIDGVALAAITPKLHDKIIYNSDTWNIYHTTFDPTKSLYRMFARRV